MLPVEIWRPYLFLFLIFAIGSCGIPSLGVAIPLKPNIEVRLEQIEVKVENPGLDPNLRLYLAYQLFQTTDIEAQSQYEQTVADISDDISEAQRVDIGSSSSIPPVNRIGTTGIEVSETDMTFLIDPSLDLERRVLTLAVQGLSDDLVAEFPDPIVSPFYLGFYAYVKTNDISAFTRYSLIAAHTSTGILYFE